MVSSVKSLDHDLAYLFSFTNLHALGAMQKSKSSVCRRSLSTYLSTFGRYFSTNRLPWKQMVSLSLSIFLIYYYEVEYMQKFKENNCRYCSQRLMLIGDFERT